MPKWNPILLYVCGAIATVAVLYIAFYFIFLNLLVDLWWFRSLDYGGYFWLRLLYRFFISGVSDPVFGYDVSFYLFSSPVYLISTRKKIPELVRVIVSAGNEIVMDKSLEKAFKGLRARFDGKQKKPVPDAKQKASG